MTNTPLMEAVEARKPRTLRRLWQALLAALLIGGMVSATGAPAQAAETADWLPVKVGSGVVEVGCTWNNGCTDGYHGYAGIDFIMPNGTAVYAAGPGTVVAANGSCVGNNCDTRGRYVEISHSDGRKSRYLHLSSVSVSVNQTVARGQQIGNSGDTMANGVPHLHYDEVVGGSKVDPGVMNAMHGSSLVQYPNYLGYSSWNAVPAWNDKFVWNDSYTPPNPDPDGDGFNGGDDWCPNLWGKWHGCPTKADISNDGTSDILAFYRHDPDPNTGVVVTNLNMWQGNPNGIAGQPTLPWQGTSWYGQLMIPAGTGNINGDNYQDLAAFYNHTDGMIDLNVWLGNSSGGVGQINAWHKPAGSGWYGNQIKPVGVGDFNKDGRADVAAFRYHDSNVRLYVWRGQSNGTFAEPVEVWNASDWELSRIISVGIHDVDGDSNLDVATFYDHAGTTNDPQGTVDYNVWYSNGDMTFALDRPWTTSGQGWDGANFMAPAITDLNADGRGDAVVFYDHPGDGVQMRVWWGTANRVSGAPGMPWESWGQGWEADRMKSAGVGDYNGDGKPDVATFYRHDGQVVDMNIWYGTGGGNVTLLRAWNVSSAWEGGRIIPAGIG